MKKIKEFLKSKAFKVAAICGVVSSALCMSVLADDTPSATSTVTSAMQSAMSTTISDTVTMITTMLPTALSLVSVMLVVSLGIKAFKKITGKAVFDAADAGDATAKAVVKQYIEYLSAGVTGLINIFDPEAVVIGGGISLQGEKLLAPVREYVAEHIFGGRDRIPPEITAAVFRDSAGILGAAALVP